MGDDVRKPNEEIISRLAFLIDNGSDEQVRESKARYALLKAAYQADRDFQSRIPLLPTIEAMIWEWWHQMGNETDITPTPKASQTVEPVSKKPVSATDELRGFSEFNISGFGG